MANRWRPKNCAWIRRRFSSARPCPATLVSIDGQPKLQMVDQSPLMRVVNTPFLILFEPETKRYFLKVGPAWAHFDERNRPVHCKCPGCARRSWQTRCRPASVADDGKSRSDSSNSITPCAAAGPSAKDRRGDRTFRTDCDRWRTCIYPPSRQRPALCEQHEVGCFS